MDRAYLPRLNGRDFLYACFWEINKPDVHGAHLVRQAMQRTFWINLRFGKIQYQSKEKQHEKVA